MPKKDNTINDQRADGKRIRTIRRLASFGQRTKFAERLAQISDIASGKAGPEMPREKPIDYAKILEDGIASRSPRNALDKLTLEEQKKRIKKAAEDRKRREKGTRDRQHKGGEDRDEEPRGFTATADVNV